MRIPALLLVLTPLVAAEDLTLKAPAAMPATELVQALGTVTGATYLYAPTELNDRILGGDYDFRVPKDRLPEVADFLIRQCGLECRSYPPIKVILPRNALESSFRVPGLKTEIRFDRGPGAWTRAEDAVGSLSTATVDALLAEAAGGKPLALDVLAATGPRTPPMIAALVKLLAEPAIRSKAATALACFGFAAKPALGPLRDAAKADPGLAEAVRAVEAARHPALLDPALANQIAPFRFVVRFDTTQGTFDVEVTRDWAPLGADRFYNLVRIGYFDGCRFFRVVPGFVAQFGKSGDPEVNKHWWQAAIKDDPVQESNKRGFVSFAMSEPNSRSTQVFVNLADNPNLDKKGFAPFGRVVSGMDVVDKLYGKYGEDPDQGHLHFKGDDYLKENFPMLDRINSATILD